MGIERREKRQSNARLGGGRTNGRDHIYWHRLTEMGWAVEVMEFPDMGKTTFQHLHVREGRDRLEFPWT
ncbi:hypothetical protein GCM10011586_26280 [Silvibacterium dinghuense]|nr:hypothetical protein GCM10011586_26280 [Silvibacterium dinghuense]